MMGTQRPGFLRLWMIPMKGKGHLVTAINLASGEDLDISRPLTTDPWDNALMLKYERGYQDSASDK